MEVSICSRCQKQLPSPELLQTGPTGIHRLLFSSVPREHNCRACTLERLRSGERLWLQGNLAGVALPVGCLSIFFIGGPLGFALGLVARGRATLGIVIGILVFFGLSFIQPFRVWRKTGGGQDSSAAIPDVDGLLTLVRTKLTAATAEEEITKADELKALSAPERQALIWLVRSQS